MQEKLKIKKREFCELEASEIEIFPKISIPGPFPKIIRFLPKLFSKGSINLAEETETLFPIITDAPLELSSCDISEKFNDNSFDPLNTLGESNLPVSLAEFHQTFLSGARTKSSAKAIDVFILLARFP